MPYLFVHFIGEGPDEEQVYFSLSNDGLNFEDLNQGQAILKSSIGEKGARDPFIIYDEQHNKYFIIATDLRIEKGLGWQTAIHSGSRDILVWESDDLIHWTKERSVTLAPQEAGNLWAPEVIYDDYKESFLVFWASQVKGKHCIFYAYTKDFVIFTNPELFIEKTEDVIDTTIVYDQGFYYRFTKNEENSRIFMDRSTDLTGDYNPIHSSYLEQLEGVEGPQIYQLDDGVTWALITDQFKKGTGYSIALSTDLASGEFKPLKSDEYDFGKTIKRHGSVIKINDQEADALKMHFK
ncbi:glycoside hydrolase family 43 protein [Fundicoccus sp. Sow4_H7]|uniref:glycoside hydrolase family 43 protein n=1 Tax=Fundicoccus sp. Sow4_H7 TaxID=3438784 RepID=UPI003F92C8A8